MGAKDDGKVAVLLMAYGAAQAPKDVSTYLKDIRGGKTPSPELVTEIRERYRLMGGKSPLIDITRAQAAALEAELNKATRGGYRVHFGMRHSPPTILDAVGAIVKERVSTVVAMPLTPYYSAMSAGAYLKKYEEAVRETGAAWKTVPVGSWCREPLLIEAFAAKLSAALGRYPDKDRASVTVLFTAHSLPERILETGDPYPRELYGTAELVARRAGIHAWDFAYQSQGRTEEPWLGPDVGAVLERLASTGVKSVLVAPFGFVSDHMETLYDDDVLYKEQAGELGVRFERVPVLNDDPTFIRAMAAVVRARLSGA